jgi:cephalosporin hydroxylase
MNIEGHFVYKGLVISQNKNIEPVFTSLINTIKPKRILEIGTFHGGLTLLLRDILDQNGLSESSLRTYDIMDIGYLNHHIKSGAKIEKITKSLFNHVYDGLSEPNEAKDYIQMSGPTIVVCDGGSKKNEFKLLAEFLKPGDIIMAHDYARNEEHFNKEILNKVWNWMEIQDSDIKESIDKYALEPYMNSEFENVAWICVIKK